MSQFIFLNDQIIKRLEANISVDQRGFLYGDGLFESCKIFNSRIINFSSHLDRLSKGLKYLKFIDNQELIKVIIDNSQLLINKNNCSDGMLRISISRGIGSNGYLPKNSSKALIIIETKNNDKINYPEIIKIGISNYNPAGFFFKSQSALTYVLTKIEASSQGLFDNILINNNGNICETSSANIFWVKNQQIFTSDDQMGIVLGCIRKKIIESKFFNVKKITAKLADIIDADEVFLTNSSYIVLGVDSLHYQVENHLKVKNYSQKNMTQIIKKNLQNELEIF